MGRQTVAGVCEFWGRQLWAEPIASRGINILRRGELRVYLWNLRDKKWLYLHSRFSTSAIKSSEQMKSTLYCYSVLPDCWEGGNVLHERTERRCEKIKDTVKQRLTQKNRRSLVNTDFSRRIYHNTLALWCSGEIHFSYFGASGTIS